MTSWVSPCIIAFLRSWEDEERAKQKWFEDHPVAVQVAQLTTKTVDLEMEWGSARILKKSDWGFHPLIQQSIQVHRPLVYNTWSNFFSKEVVGRNITLWSVLFRITTQAFQCNLYSLSAFWFYITFHESLPLIFNLLTCTTLLWIDTWGPLLHRGIDVWSRFHLCIKYPQPKAMKLPWKTI